MRCTKIRCMALAVALAAALVAGCGAPADGPDSDELVIYSPHSDEIETEYDRAFRAWYRAETGRDVVVSWPDAGGTTQIMRRIQDKFRAGRYDVDVVFGGGPIFERMKQLGFLAPCKLPNEALAALPETVAGQRLYDPEYYWYGAAISTFGLIYNKEIVADRSLPPVASWETMADPAYFGLVGTADPSKSGSVRKAFEIILQAYGYEEGMSILVRMAGNAREFYDGASEIPRSCAQGFIALGPCIDFYAQRQMAAAGGGRLGFVAPKGLTVVNADPIGVLKNAPNRRVAERFVEFVMRPAGQRLWMFPAGTEGGPKRHALQRLAVLPRVYDDLERLGVEPPMDPFDLPPADFYEAETELARLAIMPDYLQVALVENHEPLREAWQAIIETPGAGYERLVEPLVAEEEMLRLGREVWTPVLVPEDAPPEEQDALRRRQDARLRRKSDIETAWSEALRRRYREIAQHPK